MFANSNVDVVHGMMASVEDIHATDVNFDPIRHSDPMVSVVCCITVMNSLRKCDIGLVHSVANIKVHVKKDSDR